MNNVTRNVRTVAAAAAASVRTQPVAPRHAEIPARLHDAFAAEFERCRAASRGPARGVQTPLGFQRAAAGTFGDWQSWVATFGPVPILLAGFRGYIGGGDFAVLGQQMLFGSDLTPETPRLVAQARGNIQALVALATPHVHPLAEAMYQTALGLLQLGKIPDGRRQAVRIVHQILQAADVDAWRLREAVTDVPPMVEARARLVDAATADAALTSELAADVVALMRYYGLAVWRGEVELSVAASPGMVAQWPAILAWLDGHVSSPLLQTGKVAALQPLWKRAHEVLARG